MIVIHITYLCFNKTCILRDNRALVFPNSFNSSLKQRPSYGTHYNTAQHYKNRN